MMEGWKMTKKILMRLSVLICCIAMSLTTWADARWKKVLDLEGRWRFTIGDNMKWIEPKYNDSEWEQILVPARWENEGFHGYDGFGWYRTSFEGIKLSKDLKSYNLMLGYIDDADEVYFNGRKIGASGSFPPHAQTAYNALRNYYIPKEYINFAGKNVIAVRVFDKMLDGGIVGGDIGIFTDEDEMGLAISLRGMWDFATVEEQFGMRPRINYKNDIIRKPTENLAWKKISVPAPWDYHGYDHFDGTAWYRKQFEIPKELATEDLILMLGKVDDYDQTYFNGRLIGSTNKHDQLRIYTIPQELVIAGGVNVVTVFVHDREFHGGIWEGPVGILKQSNLTRFMRYRN